MAIDHVEEGAGQLETSVEGAQQLIAPEVKPLRTQSLREFITKNHAQLPTFRDALREYEHRGPGLTYLPQDDTACGDYLLECGNLFRQLKSNSQQGTQR